MSVCSSWKRGTNEITNSLVRPYLPKATDLSRCQTQLDAIAEEINNRLGKTLNAYSPLEVYREMLRNHHEASAPLRYWYGPVKFEFLYPFALSLSKGFPVLDRLSSNGNSILHEAGSITHLLCLGFKPPAYSRREPLSKI